LVAASIHIFPRLLVPSSIGCQQSVDWDGLCRLGADSFFGAQQDRFVKLVGVLGADDGSLDNSFGVSVRLEDAGGQSITAPLTTARLGINSDATGCGHHHTFPWIKKPLVGADIMAVTPGLGGALCALCKRGRSD
jgi:hypothetical protein